MTELYLILALAGLFLIGMCVQSFGNAFHNTATSSLISRYADKTHQGSSQGCASSLQVH